MRVLDVVTLAQWVEAAPINDSAQVGPDVVIDTRKVTPGALFIALPGTRRWS
ncbi:UDP-N-acetylmuramoylalanyl-D-glutamyl-2,6-diaminopimelate-D-alanyl-D-alanine ligase [Cutibacterium acnes JCM 18909]|nr:UDP-N-acetylmuramoylalanyl-D-glutamyl-2,6-diaminopimelate-D-alanyl-D-alanine ligase [Cutibacterium acnes JCM 18909]